MLQIDTTVNTIAPTSILKKIKEAEYRNFHCFGGRVKASGKLEQEIEQDTEHGILGSCGQIHNTEA